MLICARVTCSASLASKANWGLSDYLAGKLDLAQLLTSTEQSGLDFVARGMVPPNPSELLMHPRFAALLEWANEHYDLVLVSYNFV